MSRRRTPVLAVVTLLLLVACGGGGDDDAAPAPTAPPTTLPPIAPLTGLPLSDQARLARPALTVKVDNSPAARPQSGLDAADVVYEEIVEGGVTRFLAVYHSTDADLIGPVRSVRPSDPDVIAPFGGLFGYSGGIAPFIEALKRTPGVTDVGVDVVDEGPDKPYSRRAGRAAPNNLYTSTSKLYAAAPGGAGRPPGRFAEFRGEAEPFAGAGATAGTTLTATVGTTTVTFDYDAGSRTYRRTGLTEGAAVIAPANVIVQFTPYQATGERDQSDTPVERAVTVGSGDALIVSGGLAVRARWSKSSTGAFTTYTDSTGAPIRLAPGRTWVELARTGANASAR